MQQVFYPANDTLCKHTVEYMIFHINVHNIISAFEQLYKANCNNTILRTEKTPKQIVLIVEYYKIYSLSPE